MIMPLIKAFMKGEGNKHVKEEKEKAVALTFIR